MATKSQLINTMSLLQNLLATGTDVNDIPSPGGSYIALNIRGTRATVAIQSPIDQKNYCTQAFLGRI
ncbi:MAG TPA: hypothetical protein VK618_05125 [Flavitalea sp.]|nr:hypothetical protein [Flavitalea sp.]